MKSKSEIYEPSDDSYLLSEVVEDFLKNIKEKNNFRVLDMGAGSGIQGKTAIDSGIKEKNVFFVDINKVAVKYLRNKFPNSNVVLSNLFQKAKCKFNLIIFNPPYLPLDKKEPIISRLATTGGKKGSEIINKFLIQSKKHLEKNGNILLLTSSLTKDIKWKGWKKKLLFKRKIFFEELYVWELK